MSRPIHITSSIESHIRALLHIKSLFIGVLVHIAIHKLLHLDGVDLTAPRNLGHALLHDLLVAALGNLLTAVEWVQDRLNLLNDAFFPLEHIRLIRTSIMLPEPHLMLGQMFLNLRMSTNIMEFQISLNGSNGVIRR